MLYKEFLLRLAELVEESEDHSFYLCHFCDEIGHHLTSESAPYLGEAIAARQMLQEHPQWVGHIADHAKGLKLRVDEVEQEYGTFAGYMRGLRPDLNRNARRVAWLREEAARL